MFAVYILHEMAYVKEILPDLINRYAPSVSQSNDISLIIYILILSLSILFMGVLIDKVRITIFRMTKINENITNYLKKMIYEK